MRSLALMGKTVTLAFSVLAAVVEASSDCSNGFTYHGCAVVDLSAFSGPLLFSGGPLSPTACQKACEGHHLAALFPESCRCGDHLNAVKLVEDAVCDQACMDDPILGMCGSTCEPNISTVYTSKVSGDADPEEPSTSAVHDPPETQNPWPPGTPPGRNSPPKPELVGASSPPKPEGPGGPPQVPDDTTPGQAVPPEPVEAGLPPSAGPPVSEYPNLDVPASSSPTSDPVPTLASWTPAGTDAPRPPSIGPQPSLLPNPSDGLSPEGDPPVPARVTGSNASTLVVYAAPIWGIFALLAAAVLRN